MTAGDRRRDVGCGRTTAKEMRGDAGGPRVCPALRCSSMRPRRRRGRAFRVPATSWAADARHVHPGPGGSAGAAAAALGSWAGDAARGAAEDRPARFSRSPAAFDAERVPLDPARRRPRPPRTGLGGFRPRAVWPARPATGRHAGGCPKPQGDGTLEAFRWGTCRQQIRARRPGVGGPSTGRTP